MALTVDDWSGWSGLEVAGTACRLLLFALSATFTFDDEGELEFSVGFTTSAAGLAGSGDTALTVEE